MKTKVTEERKLVVIGNGPSLRDFNFDLLNDEGIDTLGMNSAYRYWYRINWFPTYYCCLDPVVIESHHENIYKLIKENKIKCFFLRANIFNYYPELKHYSNVYTLDQYVKNIFLYENVAANYNISFEEHIAFQTTDVDKITTGSYSVRFGIMMGYRKIFLLGIDLEYVEILEESRIIGDIKLEIAETPKFNPNYFFNDYQQAGDRYQMPNPEIHHGNLHLQAFMVLKEDISKFNIGVRITNCNYNSKLYQESVFPYQPIELINKNKFLTALIVPTMEKELDAIINNLKLWDTPGSHPYRVLPKVPFIDLIYLFNRDFDIKTIELIRKAFEQTKYVKQSFNSIKFISAGLSNEEDYYSSGLNMPFDVMMKNAPTGGYKAGPNNMFYHMCLNLPEHEYILQMENDCIPIKEDWLMKAYDLIDSFPHHFWIMGSIYRGNSGLSYKFRTHINGNAFYAIGNSEFRNFIRYDLKPYLDRYIKSDDARIAYDCGINLFLFEKDSWNFVQKNYHKFIYTEYMQNYGGSPLLTGGDRHKIDELKNEYPDTYIVHGKLLSK